MLKILQAHLLRAFVANLKIDVIYVLYPESFCDNLANCTMSCVNVFFSLRMGVTLLQTNSLLCHKYQNVLNWVLTQCVPQSMACVQYCACVCGVQYYLCGVLSVCSIVFVQYCLCGERGVIVRMRAT